MPSDFLLIFFIAAVAPDKSRRSIFAATSVHVPGQTVRRTVCRRGSHATLPPRRRQWLHGKLLVLRVCGLNRGGWVSASKLNAWGQRRKLTNAEASGHGTRYRKCRSRPVRPRNKRSLFAAACRMAERCSTGKRGDRAERRSGDSVPPVRPVDYHRAPIVDQPAAKRFHIAKIVVRRLPSRRLRCRRARLAATCSWTRLADRSRIEHEAATFDHLTRSRRGLRGVSLGTALVSQERLEVGEMLRQRGLAMCLERIADAYLRVLVFVDQCREHLLRDGLVRRQRHALFDPISVAVLTVPFLRLVAFANRARCVLCDALAVRCARQSC